MDIQLIESEDGSHTLYVPALKETYHSLHGAVQESRHVFIEAGLNRIGADRPLAVLEVGFGTGLNVLLTWLEAEKQQQEIFVHTLEPHPLPSEIIQQLNYGKRLPEAEAQEYLERLHGADWNKEVVLSPWFRLYKGASRLEDFSEKDTFDLVYFDAFAPGKQPELWELAALQRAVEALRTGGVLVSYCASGQFRRHLKALGMQVEVLPGPPGKKEMTRAVKN